MTTVKLLVLPLILACFDQEQIVTYKNAGGRVIIRNFSNVKTHLKDKNGGVQNDENRITITGNLAIAEAPEKGFSATGQTIDLKWAPLADKRTEIRSALIRRQATVIIDSDWGFASRVENAKEYHLPAPIPQTESRYSKVDSETITYTGSIEKGTLVFPVPWTFNQTNKGVTEQEDNGKKTKVVFDQKFECDGSKGQMIIGPGKDGELNQLQTGFVEGPVHFKLIRHETPEGSNKMSTQSYVGVADRLDIDLLKDPGTVKATGHVKVDRVVDGYTSTTVTEWLVLNVTQQMEPIGIELGIGTGKINPKDGSK